MPFNCEILLFHSIGMFKQKLIWKKNLLFFFLILFAMLILVFTRQILQKYCKICNFAATHLYLVCKPDDAFQIWNITFPFHRNVQTKAKLKEKLTVFFSYPICNVLWSTDSIVFLLQRQILQNIAKFVILVRPISDSM